MVWILIVLCVLVLVFLVLWLRERRRAQVEYIAFGMRGGEDSDEHTKTNITQMENEFRAAITKLEDLGQVRQDDWGNWVWCDTGEPIGDMPN